MPDKDRILIVEDDIYLLKLLRLGLAAKLPEFEVIFASDSNTALQLAREARPKLVLLDLMLPGDWDGIEVCRRIRSDPALCSVSVVMMSAMDDSQARQAAIDAGAVDYWTKPIGPRDLLTKVRAVLDKNHADACRLVSVGLGASSALLPSG